MGLTEYKKKRRFNDTPEPEGGKPDAKRLAFVIQKHDASRLHYDFRLELRGVMKSWAVPKGPSLRPADKRLAMLTEDHPMDYRHFEGIIPGGNYGAGTVIIWDQGTYEPVGDAQSKAAQEKLVSAGLKKGSLKIRLNGEKLQGEFTLVQTKSRGENSWLLIKQRDDFASDQDVLQQDRSVISGKSIGDMASDKNSPQWQSNRKDESPRGKPRNNRKQTEVSTEVSDLLSALKNKKKRRFPSDIKPMLATLVSEPFESEGWLYEVKWDGFRSISYLRNGQVDIRSRNNKDFNKKFYPVYEALSEWKVNAVVDGEIVVVNEKGEPDFNALQEWRSEADGQLLYYVFDILWLDGYDLTGVPLLERKFVLSAIMPHNGIIRLSEDFDISASELFAQTEKLGLEGIMAKKSSSVYTPDARSKEWLKIKTKKHQEVVIAGYTRNENSPRLFSALLCGVFQKGRLVFTGPVGTGFTKKQQQEILERLRPLETSTCPFGEVPDYNKPSRFRPNPPKAVVTWVKPEVVVEVAYRAKSPDGSFRHPSFRAIREDKNPDEVHVETVLNAEEVDVKSTSTKSKSTRELIRPPLEESRKTLLNPNDETQVRNVSGHELKFTNLSKVYWPDEGYTKRDMLNYYYQIAPVMLPYMEGRPQTLNRFPNGIHGKSFYQKDVTGKVPSWLDTYPYFSEGDQREKHFLVCTDEASLLYIAGLGCIEINPWSSRKNKPDHPDWCVIDLDPGKRNTFVQVIEAANVTHQVLEAIDVPSWCKTSGSTGLHIYIPLAAKFTYEESKEFARAVVRIVHNELPSFTSIERKVSDRNGKMYLDFLQNRPQATVAGPYSLRPKPGAPVSMPLDWEEVRKGLNILDFTIRNAPARVRSEGDLFAGVLGKAADIQKARVAMLRVFGRTEEE
jgi:bifunctional non-homologous end joining protein LigD